MGTTRNSSNAINTFTAGPAKATINSCPGFSGIFSKDATPPMGNNVIFLVPILNLLAVRACPNSCSITQRKSNKIKIIFIKAVFIVPPR